MKKRLANYLGKDIIESFQTPQFVVVVVSTIKHSRQRTNQLLVSKYQINYYRVHSKA